MKRYRLLAWSERKIRQMRPTRIIVLTFLAIIFVGALLLTLPIAQRAAGRTDFFTALFTAVSAVSVTGLTLVDTVTHWSHFGQAVILVLIQIGGLGFMSIISIFYFMLNRRLGLRERLVMMESMNLDEMDGVVTLVKRVLVGTLLFELAGAIVLSAHFIPEFGWGGGIWRGVFLAVSAFCNAGFHLMGTHGMFSGMTTYVGSPVVLITTAMLILVGSTGFYVWGDILNRRRLKRFHIYTKLVLIITAVLVTGGMLMYLLMEWSNPNSLGSLPVGERFLVAFFQSISTRTAGFDVIGQLTVTDDTKLLSILFMFIGGSSGSTAGGVKTVTIGILVLSAISVLRGRQDLIVFGRKIAPGQIVNAMTLVSIGVLIVLGGSIFLFRTEGVSLISAIFETTSAYGTAGLSIGVLDMLGHGEKILLMCLMFFGKIGVLSLSIAFMMRGRGAMTHTYPTEHVIIG